MKATKTQFESYVSVQMSGRYNMFMEAHSAAAEAGLDMNTYFDIIEHYSEYKELYGTN